MQVIARPDEPLVLHVGDILVEGWLLESRCPECDGPRVYLLAYDASCCPRCNRWLEVHCPDAECLHCRLRPERPVM